MLVLEGIRLWPENGTNPPGGMAGSPGSYIRRANLRVRQTGLGGPAAEEPTEEDWRDEQPSSRGGTTTAVAGRRKKKEDFRKKEDPEERRIDEEDQKSAICTGRDSVIGLCYTRDTLWPVMTS